MKYMGGPSYANLNMGFLDANGQSMAPLLLAALAPLQTASTAGLSVEQPSEFMVKITYTPM
jgi:hypothetical protein